MTSLHSWPTPSVNCHDISHHPSSIPVGWKFISLTFKKGKEALRGERTCSVITQLSELQSWDTRPSAWFQGKWLQRSYHLPPLIANVPFAIWSNRQTESKYSAEIIFYPAGCSNKKLLPLFQTHQLIPLWANRCYLDSSSFRSGQSDMCKAAFLCDE